MPIFGWKWRGALVLVCLLVVFGVPSVDARRHRQRHRRQHHQRQYYDRRYNRVDIPTTTTPKPDVQLGEGM